MADRYLLESGAPDGYLLEDGSGVLLLEAGPTGPRTQLPLTGVGHTIAPERHGLWCPPVLALALVLLLRRRRRVLQSGSCPPPTPPPS